MNNQPLLSSYHGPIITNGLIGFWPLTENTGVRANDLSNNNYVGTLINSPAWSTVNNKTGLNFSSSGAGNYVNINNSSGVANNLTTMTVCCWVNFTDVTQDCFAVSKADAGPNFGGWGVYINDTHEAGSVGFAITDSSNGNNYEVYSGASKADGNWHQIVATVNNFIVTLYTDGVLDNNIDSPSTVTSYSSVANIQLGATTSQTNYYHGLLAYVRVYNRVLSATEINQIYNFQG
jgi:hypothetical protein